MRSSPGIALALLAVLVVSGCGSGHKPTVATAGGAKTSASPSARPSHDPAADQAAALKFSQCMRENGVPDFPDPEFNGGGGMSIKLPPGMDKAVIDAAQEKCKQYLPSGGAPDQVDSETLAKLRQFAQCMREHGVPNFPDPGADGGVQVDGNKLGMDPASPEFKAAEQACAQYRPGGPDGGGRNNEGTG